jgi:hypothetical protein
MEAARVMLVQREQPPARQSSDIGSAPATFQSNVPAGIGSRGRAGRETHELARASLRSDMALVEDKLGPCSCRHPDPALRIRGGDPCGGK